MGCPKRLWNLYPWRYSKVIWTWSWAALRVPAWVGGCTSRGPFWPQLLCDSVSLLWVSVLNVTNLADAAEELLGSAAAPGVLFWEWSYRGQGQPTSDAHHKFRASLNLVAFQDCWQKAQVWHKTQLTFDKFKFDKFKSMLQVSGQLH